MSMYACAFVSVCVYDAEEERRWEKQQGESWKNGMKFLQLNNLIAHFEEQYQHPHV